MIIYSIALRTHPVECYVKALQSTTYGYPSNQKYTFYFDNPEERDTAQKLINFMLNRWCRSMPIDQVYECITHALYGD